MRSTSGKDHRGHRGSDGSRTGVKGESQQAKHQGAKSISKKDTGRHTKDESHGSDRNTTKRGSNSI
jgi:hypothetical protein